MAIDDLNPPRNLESSLLLKTDQLSSAIASAKRVDDVICALHSLAHLLFHVDSNALAGVLGQPHKQQVLDVAATVDGVRESWKHAFYGGVGFPTVARILIYYVGPDWLACFPSTARTQVYDSFFINGPMIEIIQTLVPGLTFNASSKDEDSDIVLSNIERLILLCLLEKKGIHLMAREFLDVSVSVKYAYGSPRPDDLYLVSKAAQLLTSIPDKARLTSPAALSAHFFFKQITTQILDVAEERAAELFSGMDTFHKPIKDKIFSFIGETFARACRRGSADTLLAVAIPRLFYHVHNCLSSNLCSSNRNGIELNSKSVFWFSLIGHMKDQYAAEKMSEELLRQLAAREVSDTEAYWMLWMLYHEIFEYEAAFRDLFVEKFLHYKVFPFCCLKWILHLSVFECPPQTDLAKKQNTPAFLAITHHLLDVWAKREFVQSAPMEKQAYITAAIGLCLEQISKNELESTLDLMNSILQGVSCRLESPIDVIRKMGCSIALMFSKVIDPSNPLYLEDAQTESIDWEFGLISPKKGRLKKLPAWSERKDGNDGHPLTREKVDHLIDNMNKNEDIELIKDLNFSARPVDPDEVIDPALINNNLQVEDDDTKSDVSETSSDDSLQPYDMTDDDTDLRKKISQLSDLFAALRKADDPDGVEHALNIAEKLVRASPDELRHNAGDLVKTLVYIRCSDFAVDGEEESVEVKRQKALIALLVTCPFESVDVLTSLLYSSNLDVSQRILIIDVMTEAAQELSNSKASRIKHQQTNLITSMPDRKPWYLPGDEGPEGSSPWEEVLEKDTPLSWSLRFERTLPSRPGQVKVGKTHRWGLAAVRTQDNKLEWSHNMFPLYAAAFMLPAMQGFDIKKHGVDFLGRDFIVLGKLIHMLGVCMRCVSMHPEASALVPPLLDMLSSRHVSHHPEAYVRRSVLFASSCILAALHPSFVASALIEGQDNISNGLDWIRSWALHIAETDQDTECTMMAMTCLQLHAEMALQTSRSLESTDHLRSTGSIITKTVKKDIVLPVGRIMEL